MAGIDEEVRRLLKPTYDETRWYRDVMALDRDSAVPLLIDILNNEGEEEYARRQSALILGLLGDRRAVPVLISALHASDHLLRGHAADALGRIGDEGAAQPLTDALRDEHPFVRERAAKALGRMKSPESLAALEEMRLNEDVPPSREAAEDAIRSIKKA